jgi:hypothetical protein
MNRIFVLLLFTISAHSAPPLNFERDILPSLEKSCFKCHSNRTEKPKAKLRLDTAQEISSFEGLIKPSKPAESSLVSLIKLPKGHDDIMPPEDKAPALDKSEIEKISLWVEQGAHFGDWKEFIDHRKKKVKSGLGDTKLTLTEQEAVSKVNTLVEQALNKHKLSLNDKSDDETFLRRIYLQIIGRIPTFEEAENFLKDADGNKRKKLIENLQNSKGYVSHNFNYWANVFRVQSGQKGNIKNSWIEYLKNSLRKNTPYDKWVYEMVNARGQSWDNPQIGFYGRDMKNRLAGHEALNAVFLGTQIGCAQCHDHPYDTTTRRDYFEMFGFISGVHAQERRKKIFDHIDPQDIYKELREIDNSLKDKKPKFGNITRSVNIHGVVNFRELLFKVYSGTLKTYSSKLPSDYQYDDGKPGGYVKPDVLFGESPDVKLNVNTQKLLADWLTSPDNLKFTHVIVNRLWHKAMGKTLIGSLVDIKDSSESGAPELTEFLASLMVSFQYDMKKFNRVLYQSNLYQAMALREDEAAKMPFITGPLISRMSAEQLWDSVIALTVPDLDKNLKNKTPDFSFMMKLKASKTTDEFWDMIKNKAKESPIDLGKGTRMSRMVQKDGFLKSDLTRASELKQPTSPGHFLRLFGQADREIIEDQWKNPTVPQSLALLNSSLIQKIAGNSSYYMSGLGKIDNNEQKIRYSFLSILSRYPSTFETDKFMKLLDSSKDFTFKDLCWILANTRQFIFIK